MRILSQNGLHKGIIDVPYEQVFIGQRENEIWLGYFATLDRDCTGKCFARYSTKEKARCAMEMLHKAYTGIFFMQNIEFPEDSMKDLKECVKHGFGCITVMKDSQDVKFEPLNICFQFPTDEETEVWQCMNHVNYSN